MGMRRETRQYKRNQEKNTQDTSTPEHTETPYKKQKSAFHNSNAEIIPNIASSSNTNTSKTMNTSLDFNHCTGTYNPVNIDNFITPSVQSTSNASELKETSGTSSEANTMEVDQPTSAPEGKGK